MESLRARGIVSKRGHRNEKEEDDEEEQLAGHREIEKFMKNCKTHMCTGDQDRAFAISGGLRESRR